MTTVNQSLFTDLTAEESTTVQGGRCRRYRSYYRPSYYQPTYYQPYYGYGYGYGGYGGYGSVSQSVNVNVRYDD